MVRDSKITVLIVFDVKSEKFREIGVSMATPNYARAFMSLVVLKGCIHVCVAYPICSNGLYNIDENNILNCELWKMDGDGDGWTKLSTFSQKHDNWMVYPTRNGNWLGIWKDEYVFCKIDLEDLPRNILTTLDTSWIRSTTRMLYVETLVSPAADTSSVLCAYSSKCARPLAISGIYDGNGNPCTPVNFPEYCSFILENRDGTRGFPRNLNHTAWDKLWSINKKIIDPVCPRHTAIVKEGRVLLTLLNGPETPFVRKIQKHKRYDDAGAKDTAFTKEIWMEQADAKAISSNLEITLMDWGNASIKEIKKDSNGNVTD
ncbi:glutamate--tRNA ligase, cytoplasmic [Tanacetum coccineum]